MAMTFEEFDQSAAPRKSGALTFDEFAPEPNKMGVLGNIGMGALKGASNIGATLLRPVDAVLNAIGATDMTNEERRKALEQFFAENADTQSAAFKGGEIGAEIAGTSGVGGILGKGVRAVAPALTKIPAALESFGSTVGSSGATLGEKLANAGIRMGAGAATGAAASGLIDPNSSGSGAVIGAAFPIVGQVAAQGAKGAGWLSDAVRGRLGLIKAGQVARDVAGPQMAAIQSANIAADPMLTAGQAAAGVDRDMWQSLAKIAERNDPNSFYRMLGDSQEAARMAALKGVTPDLAQAQGARTAADLVNYPAAEKIVFKADSALAKMASNPYFKKAQASIQNLTEAQGIDFKTNPTGYLNNVKFGFDKILSGTGDSALSGAEKRVVYKLKEDLMKWIENKNPLYGQARQVHANLSGPVNQAQVLGEMQNVLQKGGGGERVTPFLDAMGRGENALLKRADQSPRFGGISDVLTPDQLAVRDKIAGEMIRDKTMAEQAKAGEGGLRNIFASDIGLPKLPSYLSVVASSTNKAITALENKISRDTMSAIVEGMKNGANANELLAAVPASEKNNALMWIAKGGPQRFLIPMAASQSAQQ